jgi:hypothetical protein
MDNFDLKKYLAEGKLLKDNHDFDQGYIYEVIIYKLRRSQK